MLGAPAPSRYLVGYVFTGAVLMWKQLNGSVQRYWAAQHSCVPSPDLRLRRSFQQNKILVAMLNEIEGGLLNCGDAVPPDFAPAFSAIIGNIAE